MKIVTFLLLLTATLNTSAQDIPLLRTVAKAYNNTTRDRAGIPGKKYWQNRSDYNIEVSFDPASRKLEGKVRISYANNSPDTLKVLNLKVLANFYKANSVRNMPVSSDDLGPGVAITDILVNGIHYDESKRRLRGTNLYLPGITTPPGKSTIMEIAYNYQLNKGSFIRTGQVDSGSFFIAYFFPRIAVYDDIDGWDEYPYAGKEEFYNDFGDFNVSITVPGNYQVWATGDLKNPQRVYQSNISDRIRLAESSDKIIDVITPNDIKDENITLKNKTNTWNFTAGNVSDFAFGLSNHYVWQANSVMVDPVSHRRTRIDAVYNPDHRSYTKVVGYTASTVALISNRFPKIPFPYTHQTVFEGLDAMEYPMMVNMLPFEDHNEMLELTVHEVFHSIFPFYVGINETKYSFMDEGWATYSEFALSPYVDSSMPLAYDISAVNNSAGTAEDMPIITPTPQLYGKARFSNKDLKPALAMHYLEDLLGHQAFVRCVQNYIRTWAGKHPIPDDFFNSIEKSSGKDLQWFWKNWYYEKNVPDLAISRPKPVKNGYSIKITKVGSLTVPIHLSIGYSDGSKANVSMKIDSWKNGNKVVIIPVRTFKKIVDIHLGDIYDVDIDPSNNFWKADL